MQFLAFVKHGYMKKKTNVFGKVIVAKTNIVHMKNETKKHGGRVMPLVPTSLRPKVKKDLFYKIPNKIVSVWVESKLLCNNHKGGTQFKNSSYIPNKILTGEFLEGLSTSIDYSIGEACGQTIPSVKDIPDPSSRSSKLEKHFKLTYRLLNLRSHPLKSCTH